MFFQNIFLEKIRTFLCYIIRIIVQIKTNSLNRDKADEYYV